MQGLTKYSKEWNLQIQANCNASVRSLRKWAPWTATHALLRTVACAQQTPELLREEFRRNSVFRAAKDGGNCAATIRSYAATSMFSDITRRSQAAVASASSSAARSKRRGKKSVKLLRSLAKVKGHLGKLGKKKAEKTVMEAEE